MKVTHIIADLPDGGAETMLYRLLTHTDRMAFESRVISLMGLGVFGEKIQELGVPVQTLGMRRSAPNPLSVLRLAGWLRSDPPDVVQTWMWHADLIGGLAARMAGRMPVAWGIHSSGLDPQKSKRSTVWVSKACSGTATWLPTRVVCCSNASRRAHEQMGYPPEKMRVIYNGFDLTDFKPDPAARLSVREELGVAADTPLIGMVARFDAPKDHRNFIQAAALLRRRMPNVDFVLCGHEIDWENETLVGWIDAAGIRDRCHLLGRREDVPRLTAALDVATLSSSYGEAFPLVLGEAMACEIPCVTTNVGDSAEIVGETGLVTPPKDSGALAEGWRELLELSPAERTRLGVSARQRIEKHFNLPDVVLQYEEFYKELAGCAGSEAASAAIARHRGRSLVYEPSKE